MSKIKKAASNAKRAAYAQKKEAEGSKVVAWIIGILLALGVIFAISTTMMQ